MEMKNYKAAEGKTFLRKVDGFIMGNQMYLGLFIDGTEDVIDNYEEVDDPNYVPPTEEKRRLVGDSRISRATR